MSAGPRCSKCGATEGTFIRYSRGAGGKRQYYYCNPCNTARHKAYRKNGGMAAVNAAIKKYERDNPLRRKAWTSAQRIPLAPCERCGSTENIHRHHDDVSKPLEVMFLCPLHHKERHRELAAGSAA